MTGRQILTVFPNLQEEDVRAALLQAAELVRDLDGSLRDGDAVSSMIAAAQSSSGLDDDDAMQLALQETRAVRRMRGGQSE